VGSESGVIGAAVRPGTDAVKAWVADMNSRGGLNCHPIKYYVADDGADTSRNAALTQQMIEERHVIAMLFLSAPLSSQAGKPILERAHVPTIGGEGGDEFFNTSPDFFPIAAMGNKLIAANYGMLAGQLTDDQKSAVGVLTCLEARICSAFGGPEAKAIAEGFGMKVLYSAQSTLVQPDYTSNCQSAKNAGVQAMFVASDGSMLSRIIRSCAKIGFHPQFATSPVALAASVVDLPEMEGLLLGGSTQAWTAPSANAQRYVTNLAKYVPGAVPTGAGGLGWAAALVLEWASKNLPDNPTPQDVEDGLATVKNNDFGGYTVPLTYAKGRPASYPTCWWALQIHNKTVLSPNGNKRDCSHDSH
jgi:branched-chain amino acid transport system substrate-binding protein